MDRARGAGPGPGPGGRPGGGGGGGRRPGHPARRRGGKAEILLVHRPAYDDWSFPKGKAIDASEALVDAARREVLEETGYECTVGPEIATLEYPDRNGNRKLVRYWAMGVAAGEFTPNSEVDEIRWVPADGALHLLSYDRDRAVLRSYLTGRGRKARR